MAFHSAIALGLVATGEFVELLPLLAFAQGFLGIFETASYFSIIKKRPELPRSRFHPWAPLLFIAANIALLGITYTADPWRANLTMGALALVGLIGYLVLGQKSAATASDAPRPAAGDGQAGDEARGGEGPQDDRA
jgi:hypothetical protein